MTRILAPLLLFACIGTNAYALSITVTQIFISPTGKDQNDGRSESQPVATLEKGLEIARNSNDDVKRLHLTGVFHIEKPLVLTAKDTGTSLQSLNEGATIDGGRQIKNWKPYKNGIWQADVPDAKKNGDKNGWDFRQLYVNGALRHRARTPNEGFYRVAGFPEGTPKTVNYHTDCQSFEFKPGDIDPNWKNPGDIDVVVYYFWSDNHLPIETIDTEKNIVRFKYKGGKTFTDNFSETGARYFVENVFEALDQPGEWYLDKTEGILYYMPQEGENMNDVEVIAPFATELLRIEGDLQKGEFAAIKIEGITFQHCNFVLPPGKVNDSQGSSEVPAAVNLQGTHGCSFSTCVFRNLGTYGIDLHAGCTKDIIMNCRFENLAAGAIRMNGGGIGSNPLAHTKENIVQRNEIKNYGMMYPSAVGIILKNTYNNTVHDNDIHHGYYTGISVGWVWGYGPSIARNNTIAHNHIHDIGFGVLSDMGGIYTLGQSSGTIILNNVIHDISAHNYGGWGIYSDEGSTGLLIEKNIVYNTDFAGYDMHFGRDVIIRNNIFALGKKDQINRTRGEEHISLTFENNIVYWKEGVLFSGDWKDKEYQYYTGNSSRFTTNKTNFQSDWNIFYNPLLKLEEVKFDGGSFADWQKRGYDKNSIYVDPHFVDPDKFDFRLQPDSPALQRGFVPISLEHVPGLHDGCNESEPLPEGCAL
jgi:hypothetical protein